MFTSEFDHPPCHLHFQLLIYRSKQSNFKKYLLNFFYTQMLYQSKHFQLMEESKLNKRNVPLQENWRPVEETAIQPLTIPGSKEETTWAVVRYDAKNVGFGASILFFFFLLTAPCNVWDLSSPARDETCAPAVEAQNPNQLCLLLLIIGLTDFPGSSDGRVCLQCGRPGLGRSPGEENGNTLQYACLENSMDRGAWQTIVHRGCKETQLSYWHFLSYILSEDFLSPSQPEFQDIKF